MNNQQRNSHTSTEPQTSAGRENGSEYTRPDAKPATYLVTDAERFTHIWQLFGYAIFDSRGQRLGTVSKVWANNAAGTLQFIGLRTGRVRRMTHVIPASDAPIDDTARSIRVAYPADSILRAPVHNSDIPLNLEQQGRVMTYYGHP